MNNWYARNMVALAAWWANFTLRRPEFEAKYAVLGTYKNELIAIGAWMAYWTAARHSFDELSKQQSAYFNAIAGNDPSADPPAPITWTMPPGQPAEVPPGIEKFIRDVRREVVGYTNYAKADGEAMGFEATAPASVVPADQKPDIHTSAAATGYEFALVVSKRAESDMWEAWILEKGAANWTKQGTYSGKSANVTITPTTPGEPQQIQVRVQLRKNNANYGQPSDPVYVTLNP